jgi:D-alanine-D-alanine ligase
MRLSDRQIHTLKTKHLAILCGGRSLEHEISLISARWVLEAAQKADIQTTLFWLSKENRWYRVCDQTAFLQDPQQVVSLPLQAITPVLADPSKQWQSLDNSETGCLDIVFPVMHGLDGEDGPMQGLCQYWDVPFIGPNLRDAVYAMNKRVTKDLLEKSGIPLVPWLLLIKDLDADNIQLPQDFEFPVFVKVSNGGSSIGVYKVNNQKELETAVKNVWALDRDCLIEKSIEGQEIEVAALIGDTIEISEPGELEVFSDYYDYRSKYLDKGASKPHVVANISAVLKSEIKATTEKVCKVLGCEGLARIDFFVDKQGGFYVNEVNPIPGFTPISLFPALWREEGFAAEQLLFKLMQSGFHRHDQKNKVLNKMRQIAQEAMCHE